MVRTSTLPRLLAAALAIAALSAQAAGAQPLQDLRSPDTQAAAVESQSRQDLRSPDTQAAAVESQSRQDLRSPDSRPSPMFAAPPVTAQQPLEVRAPSGADDGNPWAAIGIAGVLLIGTVAVTRRTRRRARVAA